ncbi:MAG: cupin domain-containing protein [Ectothiorhodospiraceae bacterium]|nr:cupin domain-containing protein [Ectothiorhodospiraceae bacterium]MCH8503331.1 cupin domain-containing protein [Ectothiorhodospiraceae bacterium]
MSENFGPFQAINTYIHLGPDGTSIPIPVTSTFWEELASGAFSHLGPGRLVSTYEFTADWSTWERHPEGEEVVVLISGAMDLILSIDGQERGVTMSRPGQLLIIPRGAWHTANVNQRAVALFVTAGEGTEHSPR